MAHEAEVDYGYLVVFDCIPEPVVRDQQFLITKGFYTIGDEKSDLPLYSPSIKSTIAELVYVDEEKRWKILNKNGSKIYLNGKDLPKLAFRDLRGDGANFIHLIGPGYTIKLILNFDDKPLPLKDDVKLLEDQTRLLDIKEDA